LGTIRLETTKIPHFPHTMSTLRPVSVCDTTPLQRFESQSSSGEEPSSPTASSIIAAASGPNHNNNNNVKLDLQLPTFVDSTRSQGSLYAVASNKKPPLRGPRQIFGRILTDLCLLSCGE